jgi:hypothetical protein
MTENYIYAISDGESIKIGVSQNIDRRLSTLSTGNATQLKLIGFFSGGYELEREIHSRFVKVRDNGEWMKPTPDFIEYLNEKISDKFIINDNGVIKFYPKMKNLDHF